MSNLTAFTITAIVTFATGHWIAGIVSLFFVALSMFV